MREILEKGLPHLEEFATGEKDAKPADQRGPPQSDLLVELLDQTPTFDPAEPDPVPDFEFDQSVPGDFDP